MHAHPMKIKTITKLKLTEEGSKKGCTSQVCQRQWILHKIDKAKPNKPLCMCVSEPQIERIGGEREREREPYWRCAWKYLVWFLKHHQYCSRFCQWSTSWQGSWSHHPWLQRHPKPLKTNLGHQHAWKWTQ